MNNYVRNFETGELISMEKHKPKVEVRGKALIELFDDLSGKKVLEAETENIINNVEERLYELGESEVVSHQIGELVLDELAACNEVAYVRFASVFHKFETLDDFVKILKQRDESKRSL